MLKNQSSLKLHSKNSQVQPQNTALLARNPATGLYRRAVVSTLCKAYGFHCWRKIPLSSAGQLSNREGHT